MTDTITVRLKNMWFAPTAVWEKNRLQSISGRRFKPGTYTWPKAILPFLPSSAIVNEPEAIVENPFGETEVPDGYGGMQDTQLETPQVAEDYLRAGAEQASEIVSKAEANLAKRRESAAKARAAKQAKKDAAEAVAAVGPADEGPF